MRRSASRPSRSAWRRASSSMAGLKSIPVRRMPCGYRGRLRPVPMATSRTSPVAWAQSQRRPSPNSHPSGRPSAGRSRGRAGPSSGATVASARRRVALACGVLLCDYRCGSSSGGEFRCSMDEVLARSASSGNRPRRTHGAGRTDRFMPVRLGVYARLTARSSGSSLNPAASSVPACMRGGHVIRSLPGQLGHGQAFTSTLAGDDIAEVVLVRSEAVTQASTEPMGGGSG
jgi:hypothetical protein